MEGSTVNELRTIDLNGRQVAWAEYGDPGGVPVLLLHGTPGCRLGVAHHHERYARQGLHVIAPDRPGYGKTDPVPGRTLNDVTVDNTAILDALQLDDAFAVGVSGGGPHALALAAAAPTRVRAVGIIVGAAPLQSEEISAQIEVNRAIASRLGDRTELRSYLGTLRTTLLDEGLAAVLDDAPASDRAHWVKMAETSRRSIAEALAPGVQGMLYDYQAIFLHQWDFKLSQINNPVVWAHGDDDRNVPITAASRVAKHLPDCRFITWHGIGHAPGNDLLAEFYTRLLASRA
ncbi:alpha/beta hydrolase [Rhodococcus qingshengii]|uniref:Alpha/beta hydrolase n=1 Tax=Rhodococcus qingshengii TaxID=334542 RepID=A0AAW6LQG4_RHOSG|nr:alpha/beta hydrolase [Rhodococcus qingshengii]MDE8649892.1 alpha/beta hydrolase [Rhodococcus qingshengii]